MTTEQKILKQILENEGKASIRLIGKQLGLGSSYVKYLCEALSKKGLVRNLKNKDWYRITKKGWKELKKIEKSIQEYPLKKHIARKKKTKIAKRSRKPKKKITKKPKRKPGRKVNKRIPKQMKTKTKSPKTKAKKKITKKLRAKIKRLKTSVKKKKTETSAAKPRIPVSLAAHQENKITERAPVIREEPKTEEPKTEEKAQEEIKPKETISPERKFKKLIKGFKNLFYSKK